MPAGMQSREPRWDAGHGKHGCLVAVWVLAYLCWGVGSDEVNGLLSHGLNEVNGLSYPPNDLADLCCRSLPIHKLSIAKGSQAFPAVQDLVIGSQI